MSLSPDPIEVVQTLDPRVNLDEKKMYSCLKGGSSISGKTFTTTSFSNTVASFSLPPPNDEVIIDKKMLLRFYIELTFAGTTSGGNLLNLGVFDAPRANPINSSLLQSVTLKINDQSFNQNSSDIVDALMHYYNDYGDRRGHNSMTPAMMDQSQEYSQLFGAARNPLGAYGDNPAEIARGGFAGVTVVSNTPTSAVVRLICTEQLFLSPMSFGSENSPGLTNVRSMDLIANLNDLSRAWSRDAVSAASASNVITSLTGTLYQSPEVDFQYISRNPLLKVPEAVSYPYFVLNRFPSPTQALAAASSTTIESNNIQFHSIPRKIYIFARQQNSDLTYTQTNSYMDITRVSINWNNLAGQLSQASEQELYLISLRNGLKKSFTEWKSGCGSVLCIDPSLDVALSPTECPGQLLNMQFQVSVTLNNPGINSKNIVLYIVTCDEGVLTIYPGRCVSTIGSVTAKDVLDSYSRPRIPYSMVESVYGGSFWDKLKSFVAPIASFAKKTGIASKLASFIPGVGSIASPVIKALGYAKPKGRRVRGGALREESKSEERYDDEVIEEENDEDIEEEDYSPELKKKGVSKSLMKRVSRR